MRDKECYQNSLMKVEPYDVNMLLLDLEMLDVPNEEAMYDELDPCATESDSQTTLVEYQESFLVDHQEPTKLLQMGRDLPLEAKEKLKGFLYKNLDVFAWMYEDIVGIDPKVSCHHLKTDPKFARINKSREPSTSRDMKP